MSVWKLTIALQEPVSCGRRPLVGNETPAHTYIPCTALRGAIAESLLMNGSGSLIPAWFGGAAPRWSPAWPAPAGGQTVVPMPKCFLKVKTEPDSGGKSGWFNTLSGALPIGTEWTRVKKEWMRVDSLGSLAIHESPTSVAMHLKLNYDTQTAMPTALFSRSEIEPFDANSEPKLFVAWVDDPGEVLKQPRNMTIFIGKRRSAGNGEAFLKWSEESPNWTEGAPHQSVSHIQLMTDALIPGEFGGWRRSLDERFFEDVLKLTVKVTAACETREIPGWSGPWGMPREQAAAIAAGSTFRVQCEEKDGAKLREALKTLQAEGIGVRRGEGFGWIAVDPEWLWDENPAKGNREFEEPKAGGRPLPWPGICDDALDDLERIEREDLVTLIADAQKLAKDAKESRAQLSDLAQFSLRTEEPGKVFEYLDKLADRPNDRGWAKARKAIRIGARWKGEKAHLRFLLATAASLAKEEE